MEERERYRYRISSRKNPEQEREEKRKQMSRHFLLLRWMTAGMLFLLLAVSFYFDFSYHGFDREYVEKCLQDDTLWQSLVTQVSQWLNTVIKR